MQLVSRFAQACVKYTSGEKDTCQCICRSWFHVLCPGLCHDSALSGLSDSLGSVDIRNKKRGFWQSGGALL